MSVAETLPLQDPEGSHQSLAVDEYEEQTDMNDTGAAERPLGRFEKSLFALVSGMVTKNEVSFITLLLIIILEDIQLSFFSWRPELFDPATNFSVIQYIFNPVYYLVKNITVVMYIASFVTFVVLAAVMAYCTSGLVKGRLKVIWPLQVLRILTVLASTILFLPIIEALAQPLTCTNGYVTGFPAVSCTDGLRYALYGASAVGALFIVSFGSLMSLLYFEPSPKAKVGKSSGYVDLFYVLARVAMVLINTFANKYAASIVCTGILALLTGFMMYQQPFYDSKLNNLRFGLFFSSVIVAIISIAGAFAEVSQKELGASTIYIAAKLVIGFLSIPAGYYLNIIFVKYMKNHVYVELQGELSFRRDAKMNNAKIHKSQLELIYSNVADVLLTKAKEHVVMVYHSAAWAEISARFIREAYLNDKAVTLASDIFEVAFEQFPKSAHLHLMYIEYIKEYLPQLSTNKYRHIKFLNKRCSMTLNQKFQLYQFQQTDKQAMARSTKGGEEDEMNYISMVEFQSLESRVRKYHFLTLQELRDFWQSVRNSKTKEELMLALDSISSSVQQTTALYTTLLKRFPHSTQVMNLYARFQAVVLADRDYAKELSDAAKDQEALNQKVEDGEENKSETSGQNKMETHSIGSSTASDRSRAALMLKKKREIMEERLDNPIRGFLRNVNMFTLVFVLLMAASASLSYTQIYTTNDALKSKGFSTLLSRTTMHRFGLHLRRLNYYSFTNNTARLTKTRLDLYEDLLLWRSDVMKLYNSGPGSYLKSSLRVWDGSEYKVEKHTGLEISAMIENAVQYVNYTTDLFKDQAKALKNPQVRLVLDNVNSIANYFTLVRDVEISDYISFITTLRSALLSCKSAIGILAFIFSLIMPYFSYNSFQARQGRILELLLKLPRKAILDIVTQVEEEIEVMATDDSHAVSSKGATLGEEKRWKFILPAKFLIALVAFYIVNVVKVYFVVSHVDNTVVIPTIYDPLNLMESLAQKINRYSYDVFDNSDTVSYAPDKAMAEMRSAVEEAQDTLKELNEKLADHLPPRAGDDDPIYIYWRKGACFLIPKEKCDTFPYDKEVGYTKALATSGLDLQISTFIATADTYLNDKIYLQKTASKEFKLLEYLNSAFYEEKPPFFSVIINEFNKYAEKSTITATIVLFSLATCVFITFGVYYYIGFSQQSQKYSRNNRLLVCLVFSINQAERIKNRDLNTFVESAGASIN